VTGVPTVPFREALRTWGRIAVHSFGGPAGQIAVIHRVVVDEKRWLSEERFLHALSYCMLLPGPEAQQLVTYVGWLLHGTRGGLAAGLLFVLPGFLTILVLSIVYAVWHQVEWVTALFFGLKPAVLAIVLEAVLRLRRRATPGLRGTLFAGLSFVAIFAFAVPFPFIVAGAALLGLVLRPYLATEPRATRDAPPPRPATGPVLRTAVTWLMIWLVPLVVVVLVQGPDGVLARQAVFFSKVAVVTFGGAYAVLAYVAQQAVAVYGWLGPREMLDGLGLAETTPGPLIMVVQFVAFLGAYRHPGALDPVAAGIAGSVVTTWATFAPCFLFIFVGAPYVEYLRAQCRLEAALKGITAAVAGVALNLAVWFAIHTLFVRVDTWKAGPLHLAVPAWGTVDPAAVVIAAGAMLAVFRFRVGMLWVLGGAAVAGVLWRFRAA